MKESERQTEKESERQGERDREREREREKEGRSRKRTGLLHTISKTKVKCEKSNEMHKFSESVIPNC